MKTRTQVFLLVLGIWLGGGPAAAAQTSPRTITISPPVTPSCSEEFETVANTLKAGDTLILKGGLYSQSCRRLLTGLQGTAAQPITIRAADGEHPILAHPETNGPGNYDQNNLEIENSRYLIISGIDFQGGDEGLVFLGSANAVITLEHNRVHDTGGAALALNRGDTRDFVIRFNEIDHTGRATSYAPTGEGLYVGCNNAACVAQGHVIDNNHIHDLRATSDGGNDGIEVKAGSGGNQITNNVIHDTVDGTRFPCIFVYGGGAAPNIVAGNVLWHCGQAIQVAADADIYNNLILNSDEGIYARTYAQVPQVRNVRIFHNSVYGHSDDCLQIRWNGAAGTLWLANNAFYCEGGVAVNGDALGTASVAANVISGSVGGVAVDAVRFIQGGSSTATFAAPGALDFWPRPGSPLLGRAVGAYSLSLDFNGSLRQAPYDVGAYEAEGFDANPGWDVAAGFKQMLAQQLPGGLNERMWLAALSR